MTVNELITILEKCDPNTRIATYANNHYSTSKISDIKVWEASEGTINGEIPHIMIGNFTGGDINGRNFYAKEEVK